MTKISTKKSIPAGEALSEFFTRYGAVLERVASYVHAKVERGQKYTATEDAARWIAHDLPTLYRQTFGRAPKPLKTWRVMTMLSNAAYLGAYEALDLRAVRGKGITIVSEPRKGSGRALRAASLKVIKGGRA